MERDFLESVNILFAEDDDGIRFELKELIEDRCKNLYLAKDGVEGFEIFKSKEIDIVLSDINMPNMNGISLTSKIKELNPDAIVVLLTAFSDDNYLLQAIELGVDSYILKPFSPFKLLRKIQDLAKRVILEKESKEQDILEVNNLLLNSKAEILQDIAHHWRQPLGAVSLSIDNLEHYLKNDLNIKDIKVEEMFSKTHKLLLELSNSINTFAKIYSKSNLAQFESIDIQKIIQISSEILTSILKSENIELKIDIEDNFKIECKPKKLIQTLISIVKNSLDAKERNSIDSATITISAKQLENRAKIEVSDSCGGISEEIIDKIFEPYSSTKFKKSGVGLSLFLAKVLIENRMDGSISAKNIKNGASIVIELPLKSKEESQ